MSPKSFQTATIRIRGWISDQCITPAIFDFVAVGLCKRNSSSFLSVSERFIAPFITPIIVPLSGVINPEAESFLEESNHLGLTPIDGDQLKTRRLIIALETIVTVKLFQIEETVQTFQSFAKLSNSVYPKHILLPR